ncbi:OsmC family peroxiredoxin [Phytoactinopolyspora alkaliphila]|uniref:OsmC family peroxiredoxin n=1 Tax=Phytoactinopolyspora alkaliphila TaxID=1783498 RepID=A0A6N9YIG2_9ACTN|nr:OsmC family protein [Phytoactinopolyspora alkaliphila]NED94725.1 OsmC family peroxiredoxin [Phytoactinopolyspora alkaliphila]
MAEDTHRSVSIERVASRQYVATNPRGGKLIFGEGNDNEFTPVELLLTALAGCSAIDVDFITTRRADPDSFEVEATGDKIRDESGNRMENLELAFRVRFPDGDDGDAARKVLPDAIAKSRDRLCTVSRTVEVATPVAIRSE